MSGTTREEEAARLLALPDLTRDERRYVTKWRDGKTPNLFFRGTVLLFEPRLTIDTHLDQNGTPEQKDD